MIDFLLHTGLEHPSLVWILVPTVLAFFAGLWFGASSGRVRDWLDSQPTEPTD